MPPKRRRSDPSSSGPSLTDASPSISNPPETPKAKRPRRDAFTDLLALRRYTPGSTSRSSAAMYLKATKNAQKAFKYECMCLDRVQDLLNHGLESKEKTDGEGEPEIPSCDGGETCLCNKPASRHKKHPWVLTFAGSQKINDMRTQVAVRNPDNFEMYTKNDHAGYGVMQVMENLIIDFATASRIEGNWQEQWALCEAMAIFYMGGSAEPLNHVDDMKSMYCVWNMITFMFLSMLITLEEEGLLGPNTKVKNLGMIMAMFIHLIDEERPYNGESFDIFVYAFAIKYKVELIGLHKSHLGMLQDEVLGKEDLLPEDGSEHPWVLEDALEDYMELEAASMSVGGSDLDITAWTSAERKKHSFNGEDPISDETLAAMEEGGILTFED